MAKRIVLSLLFCAMVLGVSFPSVSFALTDEQQQIVTRIETLQSIFGMRRDHVDKKMKPEKVESEKRIYTYDNGLTKVNFEHKKKMGEPSHIDTVYYITADMPDSTKLTMPMMQEALQGKGIVMPLGENLYVINGDFQIIISFGSNHMCKQIQFLKTA